jgi:magnesium-transporting ATPase (P-type)
MPVMCHAVKMVTGDQQLIGIETARQLGMGTNIHKIDVLLQVSHHDTLLVNFLVGFKDGPTCRTCHH